ncbi:MAG: hypothetical protein D4R88_07170 [Methanosarcinales archaeon]|nr:MAG: hypothetical protein D4R88_07170 [Methanosarcinales archaeon]
MKKMEGNISGAVKVKQLVSQVSKTDSVLYLMTSVSICSQGQTTWNTDFADDADEHGYDLPVFVFDQ